MSENKEASGGIGITTALFLIFLVLKLVGAIDWSWWWVTSPLWIVFATVIFVFLVAGTVISAIMTFDNSDPPLIGGIASLACLSGALFEGIFFAQMCGYSTSLWWSMAPLGIVISGVVAALLFDVLRGIWKGILSSPAAVQTKSNPEPTLDKAEAIIDKAMANADATLEKAMANADATFDKAMADADAMLDKAMADADAALENADFQWSSSTVEIKTDSKKPTPKKKAKKPKKPKKPKNKEPEEEEEEDRWSLI
jgi:hypothetical protein